MKTLHLFQYGKGKIGEALLRQVVTRSDFLADHYGIRLEYIGFCGQSRSIIDLSGLNRWLEHNESRAGSLSDPVRGQPRPCSMALLELLLERSIPDLCVIDTTAAELVDVHRVCLRKGIPVITANKKPLAVDYPIYQDLQHLGRGADLLYWYETTVGAGLPIISTIREMIATGDTVTELTGCLSGTLGYICSQLDVGGSFSDIVKQAKALGYTEPDPRDDLNGMDVARKALILAREIGYPLNLSDITVESMVSARLIQAPTVDAFMAELSAEDDRYQRLLADCREGNEVLRYVVTIRQGACEIGVRRVPKDSPTGSLGGPDNLVALTTKRYRSRPLVIRGPGAGADVTAAGLFGDLIKAATAR